MTEPEADRPTGTTEWEAGRYHRLADPHERWAVPILDRLAPGAGELIIDAGCGSGRITRLLCGRLAEAGGGKVVAVDGSAAMVEEARSNLAEHGEAVKVLHSDLLDLAPQSWDDRGWSGPADAVFSSAVFHWIKDHGRLFQRMFDCLLPGGRIEAQCGGAGNVSAWEEAIADAATEPDFSAYFTGWEGPWNFATPEETEQRLHRAGFKEVRCWLEERPTVVEDARGYLEAVSLAAHRERLPASRLDAFTDAVLQRVAEPNTLRYIRLNIEAVRPAE